MRDTKIGKIQSPLQTDLDGITDEIVEELNVDLALFSVSYNSALVALGVSGSKSNSKVSRIFPHTDTICSSVIKADEPLIIADARNDPRTCRNPCVKDGRVVGYIGMPVRNADIGAIGAICGITSEPRTWSDADQRYLRAVSQTVESMVLREMYRLESTDASNLISEYDQIIAAFSLVRADATSIHNDAGGLVFANKALMEHVSDEELRSFEMTEQLLKDPTEDSLTVIVASGTRFDVRRQRTKSGYLVCQWTLDRALFN